MALALQGAVPLEGEEDPGCVARGDKGIPSALSIALCSAALEGDGLKPELDLEGDGACRCERVLCAPFLSLADRGDVFGGLIAGVSRGLLERRPTAGPPPGRGDGRKPITRDRSVGGWEWRLPVLEFDCTDEERRTPGGRHVAVRHNALPMPPVPPSASLLSSSRSLSCCCNWSVVA